MNKNRIVANGQRRIQQTEDYQEKVREIRKKIQEKYLAEMVKSNLFKRLMLELKMCNEIHHEIQELAPDRALYLVQSPQTSEEAVVNGDE